MVYRLWSCKLSLNISNTWRWTGSWIAALLLKDVLWFSPSWDKLLQTVIAVGINVYEWIQSQAIKPPLVLCKWVSSTSLVHHISLHNPIWGVWAIVKWPVALLITLAALLHLWPTSIKWAACLFLDVIKGPPLRPRAECIIMFSVNVTDIFSSSHVFFALLLLNVVWLILPPKSLWNTLFAGRDS